MKKRKAGPKNPTVGSTVTFVQTAYDKLIELQAQVEVQVEAQIEEELWNS